VAFSSIILLLTGFAFLAKDFLYLMGMALAANVKTKRVWHEETKRCFCFQRCFYIGAVRDAARGGADELLVDQ
jgi:cytochrome b subunit of formate dehydrogenase